MSGKLGHVMMYDIPIKYIGPLSRFKSEDRPIKYDILALISGPEPQRSMLETLLLDTFKAYDGKVKLVRGIVEDEQRMTQFGSISVCNFMTSSELNNIINESDLIISRSGYTTLMDLAKLNKKAFFIPTPGQFEQKYLAKRLTDLKIVPSCQQNEFTIEKLMEVPQFSGLRAMDYEVNFKKLFSLFQSE